MLRYTRRGPRGSRGRSSWHPGRRRRRTRSACTTWAICWSTFRARAARRGRSPRSCQGRPRRCWSRCARSPRARSGGGGCGRWSRPRSPMRPARCARHSSTSRGSPSATDPARDSCSTGTTRARTASAWPTHAMTDEAAPGADEVSHYAATEGLSSTQILALVSAERAARGGRRRPAAGTPAWRAPAWRRAAPRSRRCTSGRATPAEAGRRRLAFEELLFVQLALLARRARADAGVSAVALDGRRGADAPLAGGRASVRR